MDITFEIDDELIAAAEAVAARHGTSVSHLVRTALEQLVAVDDGTSGVTQEHDDVHHDQKGDEVIVSASDRFDAARKLLNSPAFKKKHLSELKANGAPIRYRTAMITLEKATEILGFSLAYTAALLKSGELKGDDGLVLESSVHAWMKKHDVHFPLTDDEKALLEKPTPPEFFED